VVIEPNLDLRRDDELWWQNQPSFAWVQQTRLGLDAFSDGQQLVIWTTDLVTGDPVPGVSVELLGRDESVVTDADGLASVALTRTRLPGLFANAPGDGGSALLVPDWWGGGWELAERDT